MSNRSDRSLSLTSSSWQIMKNHPGANFEMRLQGQGLTGMTEMLFFGEPSMILSL